MPASICSIFDAKLFVCFRELVAEHLPNRHDLRPELLTEVRLADGLRDTGEPAPQRTHTGDEVFPAGPEAEDTEQGCLLREPGRFGSFFRELGPLLR